MGILYGSSEKRELNYHRHFASRQSAARPATCDYINRFYNFNRPHRVPNFKQLLDMKECKLLPNPLPVEYGEVQPDLIFHLLLNDILNTSVENSTSTPWLGATRQ